MDLIFQDGIASNSHLVEEIDTKRKRKHDIIAVASYFQVSGEAIEWQQHLKGGVNETGVSMIGQSVIRNNKSLNHPIKSNWKNKCCTLFRNYGF